jgi:hypothetical protein
MLTKFRGAHQLSWPFAISENRICIIRKFFLLHSTSPVDARRMKSKPPKHSQELQQAGRRAFRRFVRIKIAKPNKILIDEDSRQTLLNQLKRRLSASRRHRSNAPWAFCAVHHATILSSFHQILSEEKATAQDIRHSRHHHLLHAPGEHPKYP